MSNRAELDDRATSRLSSVGMPPMWGALMIAAISSGCVLFQPPVTPNPSLLGCYRLETSLPASYGDSLGYQIPQVIQLGYSEYGQWTVVPTDPEWHPDWTIYDALPSGYVRRQLGYRATSTMQSDSVRRIPGDSIDIRFPSALGQLVLRLGGSGEKLGGRAEWVVRVDQYYLNEGAQVEASRTSCDELTLALTRTQQP